MQFKDNSLKFKTKFQGNLHAKMTFPDSKQYHCNLYLINSVFWV